MVFICGVPRSGTTLLQRIFGGHSEVFAGPEFDFIPQMIRGLRQDMRSSVSSGRIAPIVDHVALDHGFRNFIATIFLERLKASGHSVFCEKTPATTLVLPDLVQLFPRARFVLLLRDPVKIVNSMQQVKRRFLAKGTRPPRFVRSISSSVELMNDYLAAAIPAARQHPQIEIVYYDDLVTRTADEVKRLCAHVNLRFEPEMLEIERTAPDAKEQVWYSQEELRQPICKTGVVTKETLLSNDEVALVRKSVTPWRELDRFDTSGRPFSVRERALWTFEKAKALGMFLPRH